MNRHVGKAFLLVISLCLVAQAEAQTRKKKAPAKAATTQSASMSKPKTIGDILNNIEKKAETVKFNKSKSALPTAAMKAAEQPQQNVNLRAVKPPRSKELYYSENSDEAELERVLDEQIEQLFRLTQQYRKSTKRGELWLRLAELYVEKARLIEYRIQARHDKAMEAFLAGKTKTRPKLNLTQSLEYNKKAIQLYEWFVRDFPKDPKMDQALFFLGYNYFEIGDVKHGQEYYIRLTKEFPDSPYVSESYFALGEYNFDAEKWQEALGFYNKVVADRKGKLYSFGLYKSAWCNYKMQNTKVGLKLLERVILDGRRSKTANEQGAGVSRVRLATEAVRDLIVFYAEAGDPEKAREYFEEVVGKKSALANVGKLAQYYMDTGNRSGAKILFNQLIDDAPTSPRAFDYQHNIVKMYQAAGQTDVFIRELYVWIDNYAPGTPWYDANKKDKELVAKATDVMESTLRNYVLQQHQVAQNARTPNAQTNAKKGYELYFKTFTTSAKLDEMHFFFGELLFDIGDFERASFHYAWVYNNQPKSAYAEKSLLNALLAYEKKLPSDQQLKKAVGEGSAPVEFPQDIKNFEAVALKYLATNPKGDNVVNVKYRLGTLYYYYNQFDPAIKIFNGIIKDHPKTDLARFSANHLLDIYNLKNDYTGLLAAADSILKVPELARSDVGQQIKDIKLRTDFKMAKEFEDKKDYEGAGKAYESFAAKNRGNGLASSAVFNSAVNYERSGNSLKAIGMYGVLAADKQKGNEDLRKKSAKFLPPLFEKTGQYAKAAQLFESYAVENPKEADVEGYYYNAALIYDGLNSYTNAIRNYEKYFEKRKNRDKVEVFFLLGRLYERMGRWDQANQNYEKYIMSGSAANGALVVEAHYRIAKVHEGRNRIKITDEWFEKTVAVQRRLAQRGQVVGVSFAAEAKYKLVSRAYPEFVALRIPRDPAKQGAAVQQKLKLLSRLQEELKKVIAYDDGYQIVSALNLQGQALQHMYVTLIETPIPKGLTPEETKQYKEGVDKIANPFRDQAIASYELAINRGFQLQAYNSAINSAQKGLAQLKGQVSPVLNTRVLLTKEPDWMEM